MESARASSAAFEGLSWSAVGPAFFVVVEVLWLEQAIPISFEIPRF